MIISTLNSPYNELYKKLHPRLKKALDALSEVAARDLSNGRYEIDGDKIFMNVMSYTTAPAENKKFEIHHKYIDIQYIISGEEIIGNETVERLEKTEGDGEDIEFFKLNGDYDPIKVSSGEFVIIFPEEPHAPGIANGTPSEVKKIVFKVLL